MGVRAISEQQVFAASGKGAEDRLLRKVESDFDRAKRLRREALLERERAGTLSEAEALELLVTPRNDGGQESGVEREERKADEQRRGGAVLSLRQDAEAQAVKRLEAPRGWMSIGEIAEKLRALAEEKKIDLFAQDEETKEYLYKKDLEDIAKEVSARMADEASKAKKPVSAQPVSAVYRERHGADGERTGEGFDYLDPDAVFYRPDVATEILNEVTNRVILGFKPRK